jgi:phage terminase small subunit
MSDKLTIKQEKYAQGLFAGLSQREAYKQAYDAENMTDKQIDEEACKLANSPKVAQRIKELTDELKNRNMVTVEWVVNNLKSVAERCMQAEPLYNKDGDIVEYTFQANGANKSLELIGKHLGMFTDKIESVNHNINEDLDKLPEDERHNRIRESMGKLSPEQRKRIFGDE